jgi:hypothetical protein
MNPLSIFKLPLRFAGSHLFINEFKKINKSTSDETITNNPLINYKINIKEITPTEVEVIISLQEDPQIVIFKFTDKLINLPKLDKHDLLIERTIMGKKSQKYILDLITKEILLIKKFDINRGNKGILIRPKSNINPLIALNKFITFDLESITNLKRLQQYGDSVVFEPIVITAYDFFNDKIHRQILNVYQEGNKLPVLSDTPRDLMLREEKIDELISFFTKFINSNYHKYVFYAHNLSTFDGVLIMESLVYFCENNGYRLEPIIRDNKLISLKIRFGYRPDKGKYRYYIKFHDSMLILLSSLDKLSKSFNKDNIALQKIDNKPIMELLLDENQRKKVNILGFIRDIVYYCERDSLALAHVIKKFSTMIYEDYKINIHDYPTISSLALAIYQSNYLKSNKLIHLISGQIYNDIKKAYHGGHTDVYKLYSDKDVHSYDYSSMYPTQMANKPMPTGKINYFEGNPLNTKNETLQTLADQLAFIKCDVYVDKSMNRPLYQTIIKMKNGETRSMCATGLFKNQWVFVPELLYYE